MSLSLPFPHYHLHHRSSTIPPCYHRGHHLTTTTTTGSELMDPKYAAEMLKYLDKKNELLEEVHKKMSFELHKLQVEEAMLMRKFYELSPVWGLNTKSVARRSTSSDSDNDD